MIAKAEHLDDLKQLFKIASTRVARIPATTTMRRLQTLAFDQRGVPTPAQPYAYFRAEHRPALGTNFAFGGPGCLREGVVAGHGWPAEQARWQSRAAATALAGSRGATGLIDILAFGMDGLDELERYLEAAQLLTWGEAVLEGAHPDKHRMVLEGGVQVMAKPGHDQYESVVRREAAGWQVARRLGFTGLVAGTVLRDVPRLPTGEPVISSIQVTWPDGRQWLTPLDEFSEEETWEAAIFDAVVAHTDHMNNNWLGVPDPSAGGRRRLRLVDTGNAFGTTGITRPNSSFYDRHHRAELPDSALDALHRFLEDCPGPVENLLGEEEANGVCQRAAKLSENGVLSLP